MKLILPIKIYQDAIVQVQSTEKFHQIVKQQTNELMQNLNAVACYDAIPQPFRFYEMIKRMKMLMDGQIASNWHDSSPRVTY